MASDARAAGVEVCPLVGSLVKRRVCARYALRLVALARCRQVGLMHAHMYASSVAAAMAATLARVPLVISEHTEATWRGPRARWFGRRAYRGAATVIAVSDSIRRRLVAEDGMPADRAATIHNACASVSAGPAAIRPRLPANPSGGPLIGLVARPQPEKGVRYFVEAAARVAAAVPDARFVVIGDGPLRASLGALVDRLGLANRLLFTGVCLDAPALIGCLDLLIIPSFSEGTPLVVLEAMFAGVPIVASAVGGIPEQVGDGREAVYALTLFTCRPSSVARQRMTSRPFSTS